MALEPYTTFEEIRARLWPPTRWERFKRFLPVFRVGKGEGK